MYLELTPEDVVLLAHALRALDHTDACPGQCDGGPSKCQLLLGRIMKRAAHFKEEGYELAWPK